MQTTRSDLTTYLDDIAKEITSRSTKTPILRAEIVIDQTTDPVSVFTNYQEVDDYCSEEEYGGLKQLDELFQPSPRFDALLRQIIETTK